MTALRTVVVPVEPAGRVLIVRAQIASGPEARLVVDTGAGSSALGRACASRLSLPIHRDLHVRTASGVGGLLGLDFFRALGAYSLTLVLGDEPRLEVTLPNEPAVAD